MRKRRRADVRYDRNLGVWLRRDRRRRDSLIDRVFAALSVLAEPSVRSQMRTVLLVMGWTAAMCVGLWGIIQ